MQEEDRQGEGMESEGREREGFRIKPSYFLPKPVKVGDELSVKIDATGARGDGIAKKDGFVIFVKGAREGEEVKVRIVEVKAKSALAEIVG